MNNNIRLGYACINETLKEEGYSFKTMTIKHFDKQKLIQRIHNNFEVTLKIIEWNIKNNIKLYRVSSNLVPLATHELNNYEWRKDKYILNICKKIRALVKKYNLQLSLHPDQFTVLNSPKDSVIKNSYDILRYHYQLAKMLGIECVLIHVGGVYGNKESSTEKFISIFRKLPSQLQELVYIENDDKSYNLEEVLSICKRINRPLIADWHHDRLLPSSRSFSYYIDEILSTWNNSRLQPKVHLSSSKEVDKIVRNHAEYILKEDYEQCLKDTKGKFNIMLECKQKEKALFNLL